MQDYNKNNEMDKELFIMNVITPLVAQFDGVLRATSVSHIDGNYKTYSKTIAIIADDGRTIKEIEYLGKDIPYMIKAVYKEFINTL